MDLANNFLLSSKLYKNENTNELVIVPPKHVVPSKQGNWTLLNYGSLIEMSDLVGELS